MTKISIKISNFEFLCDFFKGIYISIRNFYLIDNEMIKYNIYKSKFHFF